MDENTITICTIIFNKFYVWNIYQNRVAIV